MELSNDIYAWMLDGAKAQCGLTSDEEGWTEVQRRLQKLRWGRSRDLEDARGVLAVQTSARLDMDLITRWGVLHQTIPAPGNPDPPALNCEELQREPNSADEKQNRSHRKKPRFFHSGEAPPAITGDTGAPAASICERKSERFGSAVPAISPARPANVILPAPSGGITARSPIFSPCRPRHTV